MRQPYKMLVINFLIGCIVSLLASSAWMLQGTVGYYVSRYTFICLCLFIVYVFFCGIYFSKKLSKTNILESFLASVLVIPVIIFVFFATNHLSDFMDEKVRTIANPRYHEVVQMILKMNSPEKYSEEYEIPLEYWELTRGWGVFIDKEGDLINISFPKRVGPLAGSFFVYSNLDKTIYDGKDYYRVIRKKPHWFYVLYK